MKQIMWFLTMIVSLCGTLDMAGIVPEALKNTLCEDDNHIICVYGEKYLTMEILDNSTGEYSTVWENVVRLVNPESVHFTSRMLRGIVYIPESVLYNGTEYKVIGIDDDFIGTFQTRLGIESMTLPYEITFIGDRAFNIDYDCEGWFDELNLPVALRYIGESAFRNQTNLKHIRIFSPLPPICLSSEERQLKVGDVLEDGEVGPFYGMDEDCVLSLPRGFGYFYKNHPAFKYFGGFYTEYVVPWVSKIVKCPGGTLGLVYLGNGEMMVYESYIDEGNSESIEIPATVEAYGATCKIIGIGENGLDMLNVKKIVLPETIQFIGDRAFIGSRIEEIELPANCLYLANKVFYENGNLKKITFKAKEKMVVAEDALYELPDDVELYVESEIDETQLPWCKFKKIHKTSAGVEAVTVETGNSVTYNLQGMPVNNLRSGEIYIRNGKKFVAQ